MMPIHWERPWFENDIPPSARPCPAAADPAVAPCFQSAQAGGNRAGSFGTGLLHRAPAYRERPTRPHLLHVEHGNPDGNWWFRQYHVV